MHTIIKISKDQNAQSHCHIKHARLEQDSHVRKRANPMDEEEVGEHHISQVDIQLCKGTPSSKGSENFGTELNSLLLENSKWLWRGGWNRGKVSNNGDKIPNQVELWRRNDDDGSNT